MIDEVNHKNKYEISLDELRSESVIYLDIRDAISFSHGYIDGALSIPYQDSDLELDVQEIEHILETEHLVEAAKGGRRIVVYCSIGEKSIDVAKKLRQQGYDAYSLAGGFRSWLLKECQTLSQEERSRYDRQMILPQVGLEGQTKLKNAKVLIVGAGGLGSPAALYLGAAGVGTIGIADADEVDLSNLQRQIIHQNKNIGKNKAKSAEETIKALNENVKVVPYPVRITADNIDAIISDYDFVIDAVDNFETKFLINDACVRAKKPFCHGGILRFDGQVMTYVPGEGPCYRCIFEDVPEDDAVPNCSQAGILGAVAGVIGCIQALEAMKYLLGTGDLLTGRMLVFDGLSMEFRMAKFGHVSPNCKVCKD